MSKKQALIRAELTAEEKAKPYSKYYYMEMAKPDQALIDKVNAGPIDPKDALRIENRNDLLNPGYLPAETGYCMLPNGTGVVAALTKMPGVTPEMFDWWFAWHQLEPLRYKIWDPEDHFDVQVSDEDRKRLLDPNIPMRERNWGCTHYVSEQIGSIKLPQPPKGADLKEYPLSLKFLSPKDFGFDMSRFKSPNVGTAICTMFMCHFIREIKGGVELRSRFWLGYKIENKKPVLDTSNPITSNADVVRVIIKELTLHSIIEFANLAKILPKVYAEETKKTFNKGNRR
nr:hypothetical protein [Candidatus Freyarchaeota archaeon]